MKILQNFISFGNILIYLEHFELSLRYFMLNNLRKKLKYQYIKDYKVGRGAKKRDHFARAVFLLIVCVGGREDG